jgi:ATP-dependent DNA helicase RecQ
MLWTVKAMKLLKKYWKIQNLKDKQFEVINELLLGNDVIGLLPTGYGKSLCYLLPPLVTKKTIFIISPLISLMDDQKEKLIAMKIPCATLHGNNKNKEKEVVDIIDGNIRIVYMSPEYLIKGDGLDLANILVETNQMGFLAIDESHCISAWGQDFRPEYTKMKMFRKTFPQIPILAVTATATETVCQDISNFLHLNNPVLIRASFDRPNLYLKILEMPIEEIEEKRPRSIKIIKRTVNKENVVLSYIDKYPGQKIIIYANSRKDCEELAFKLNKIRNGCCKAYHAGLSKDIREKIQTSFSNGDINLIISTIAFGMGIDLIVRCVIIFGSPSSIEEYYQQIGRGGRDGLPCETVLYFEYVNLIIAKHMLKDIRQKYPALARAKENNLNKVSKMVFTNTCRRRFILDYFNEPFEFFTCGNCDNCCESDLVDMTKQFYPIIFKLGNTPEKAACDIKHNYLTEIKQLDKNNKEKHQELFLINDIRYWKKYIVENELKLDNLPDNIKFKIPKKFIKKIVENKKQNNKIDFDDKIKFYEKQINL